MLCDVCNTKEATVFLTQIVDGQMKKVNLCDSCSKEKGVTDPTGFALADLLLGLGAAQELEKGSAGQACPVCGFTQVDFKKTGRFGCAACYQTFSEGLSSVLDQMHKGTEHIGKVPSRSYKHILLDREMEGLRDNLREAVASENFEQAAEIRDQIRKLEAEAGA